MTISDNHKVVIDVRVIYSYYRDMTNPPLDDAIRRWTGWFRAAIVGSAAAILFGGLAAGLVSHRIEVSITTANGLATIDLASLDLPVKLTAFGVALLPDAFWLAGLAALWQASRCFRRGDVFALPVMQHLARFGWALLGAAVATAPLEFALGMVLHRAGRLDPPVFRLAIGDAAQLAVGGILLILLARVFGRAAALAEESSLTV